MSAKEVLRDWNAQGIHLDGGGEVTEKAANRGEQVDSVCHCSD